MMHPQEDRTQRTKKHMTFEINHRVPSEAFRIEKVGAWQMQVTTFPCPCPPTRAIRAPRTAEHSDKTQKDFGHPRQDIKTTTSVPFQA